MKDFLRASLKVSKFFGSDSNFIPPQCEKDRKIFPPALKISV